MSQQDADEFVRLVKTIQKALTLDTEEVPELARKKLDLDFTQEEFSEALSGTHLQGDEGELTDEQLEEAAGGKGDLDPDDYAWQVPGREGKVW